MEDKNVNIDANQVSQTSGAAQGPNTSNASAGRSGSGLDILDAMALARRIMLGDRSMLDCFGEATDCFVLGGTHARYALNSIGISNMFADAYQEELRCVEGRNVWYCFDGTRWRENNGAAMEKCKLFVQIIAALVRFASQSDSERYKPVRKMAQKWLERSGREQLLKDAATVHAISMSDFDKDPFLLNCRNGTLNMRTGDFRPHDPKNLLTKMANVNFDPNAYCDRWSQHINEVMMGDPDKVLFLQQALGYALTGACNYECFFILYGPTSRNGKSVTMETFATLMGDYARAARPDTIAQKRSANGSGPSDDIARLAGARFINISEPEKQMVLSSALVKTLTGNDTITARFLHENSFDFKLQGKLFINTNHLPRVTDATVFRSERVKVLPFERHFEEHEQDKGLKGQFAQPQNLSGILNWCLQGLYSLYQGGFVDCPSIKLATEEYKLNSDKVSLFIEDTLEESPGSELFTETVFEAYKKWCENNGHHCGAQRTFKQDMAAHAKIVRKRPTGQPGVNARSMILGFKFKI